MTSESNFTSSDQSDTAVQASPLVSLNDWLSGADQDDAAPSLSVVRLSSEPVYVSLFTHDGMPALAHYLEATETWSGAYVHCLGDECPACKAKIDRKRFLLLPVADLTDAKVKVLRIPQEKGRGKLLTELSKVLALPDRASVITKIMRTNKYEHIVDVIPQGPVGPDVAAAIKRFTQHMQSRTVDLATVIARHSADEMAQHERVAKRLALEGFAR